MNALSRTLRVRTFGAFLGLMEVALHVAPRRAEAQVRSEAEIRFEHGVTLFQGNDFEHAVIDFRASLAQLNSPNARLLLARSLRNLGRLAEAVPEYDRTIRDAEALVANAPQYRRTIDAARAELSVFEPQVGRILLHVSPPGVRPSARIGEVEVPDSGIDTPLRAMPGHAVVEITANGYRTEHREIDVVAGRLSVVDVTLVANTGEPLGTSNAAPPAQTPQTPQTPPMRPLEQRGMPPLAGAGIAMLAVAVVGGVAFGVFYGLAAERYASLDSMCTSSSCNLDPAVIRDGRTFETGANVALPIAIGSALVGATLLTVGFALPRRSSVRVGASPGAAWLSVTF